MLKLDNGRKTLYQWDVGVIGTLTIDGVDEVHFSNLRYGVSFNIKVVDNKVEFPPEVLQSGADVFCWAFVRKENGGYTKKEQTFNVEKRPRPADYVFEPTEILSWETLSKELGVFKEDTAEALADLEKGTIKELDKVDLITCESGVYLTSKITYRKSIISQPFTEWMPMKALLIVLKNGYETYFHWIGSAYILAGLSNAEGEFENEFTKHTFEDYATKEYVNELIGNIESGADGKSAYQIALDNGFEGTEEEWLESLNGADGFSPTAKVEQTDNGADIAITDKNGTTNVTVLNGLDGISATHSWDGTVLTVTSASGTSSANLKGDKGDTGASGTNGTSVTVKSVSESTADGGSNVVTFSDGKTVTIKNGSKGSTGATGPKGADGYTPVKGTDYFTETDKTEMVNDVKNVCVAKNQGSDNVGKILVVGTDGNLTLANMPEGASGDIIGTLDESNNILLSGKLADGTYTLKYENEDGTYTDVGTLEVGAIPDTPDEPTYTNLFNSSTCELNMRLNSSGASTEGNGYILTDYIAIPDGVAVGNFRIRYKNANLVNSKSRIGLYSASKTKVDVQYINGTTLYETGTDDNGVKYVDVLLAEKITASAYVRIAFYSGADTSVSAADAENIIVTINEEIV